LPRDFDQSLANSTDRSTHEIANLGAGFGTEFSAGSGNDFRTIPPAMQGSIAIGSCILLLVMNE
jgi:hypothetical protein